MKALFEELSNVLAKGEEAVLVTIIASSGSTPRGAGSRMLVRQDGTIKGTVGGGSVEYQAILTAMEAMKHKSSYTKGFTLNRNQVADIGMVCGGNVVVYFQYIRPDDRAFAEFCTKVRDALGRDEDSWLLLDITDETCWQMGLYSKSTGLTGMDRPEQAELALQDRSLQAGPFSRKSGDADITSNPWSRQGRSISSAADMWPRSWCLSCPMWGSGAWSWTTGRNLPTVKYFPRQQEPLSGTWKRLAVTLTSGPATMCAA